MSAPTTTSIALATAILSLTTGYFIGTFMGALPPSSNNSSKSTNKSQKKSWPNSYDVDIHPDSSDDEVMTKLGLPTKAQKRAQGIPDSEDEESDLSSSDDDDEKAEAKGGGRLEQGGSLSTFAGTKEEVKMVLVARTDLGMGKGKIAAQCSHATLANYIALQEASSSAATTHPIVARWQRHGQPKIVTQVSSLDALEELQARAMSLGLAASVIHDAGRTQIAAGSATVLAVGPGPKSVVDQISGGLKLL